MCPYAYAVHIDSMTKRDLWVPGPNSLLDFYGLRMAVLIPAFLRTNKEGVDVVFSQKLIPVTAMTVLCLVCSSQAIQGGPGDVDTSG